MAIVLVAAALLSGCAQQQSTAELCRGLGQLNCALFSMTGTLQPQPQPPPAPPQAGTCEDAQALLGAVQPVHVSPYPSQAGHARLTFAGFSILPPSGADWCRFPAHDKPAVAFAKNRPPDRHTLLVAAYLIHNDEPFDVASVRKLLQPCSGGANCGIHTGEMQDLTLHGAQCVTLTGYSDSGQVVRQVHYACIHPADAHTVVKLLIADTFPPGERYDAASLLDRLRPEYMTFVNSLEFTPLTPSS